MMMMITMMIIITMIMIIIMMMIVKMMMTIISLLKMFPRTRLYYGFRRFGCLVVSKNNIFSDGKETVKFPEEAFR